MFVGPKTEETFVLLITLTFSTVPRQRGVLAVSCVCCRDVRDKPRTQQTNKEATIGALKTDKHDILYNDRLGFGCIARVSHDAQTGSPNSQHGTQLLDQRTCCASTLHAGVVRRLDTCHLHPNLPPTPYSGRVGFFKLLNEG